MTIKIDIPDDVIEEIKPDFQFYRDGYKAFSDRNVDLERYLKDVVTLGLYAKIKNNASFLTEVMKQNLIRKGAYNG